MIRIFGILCVLTIAMIIAAGAGTFWVSQSEIDEARKKSTQALAQGISLSIFSQVDILQKTVANMAVSPNVIAAIQSEDPQQLSAVATQLEQLLPNVLKIRILPANINELDNLSIPHMGNADLLMVQETLTTNQPPVIQGQGENRHLAITAAIKKDDITIGIILASLKYDFIQSILKKIQLNDGFIDLKQGNASLAEAGASSYMDGAADKIEVSQTSWNVHYWAKKSATISNLSFIGGFLSIPALISFLAFFICYRRLTNMLREDQGSILKVVKDLMAGKNAGSYPVNINEMKAIIASIIQYKRVLDNEGNELSTSGSSSSESDGFFEEPTGFSFLDSEIELDNESFFKETESTPISSMTAATKKKD